MPIDKLNYLLQLADNALIIGHRLSEWCGHGPILEQDIALTNTALDHLGQARSLYQYAAAMYAQLSEAEQAGAFSNPSLFGKGQTITEDFLAYFRDSWDFRNVLLAEQPNGDWAYTIARAFFYDNFTVLLYNALATGKDPAIAAIAEKSLKEASYHRRWSSEWVIRLGDGTEESHQKMQAAINDLWTYTGELFSPSTADLAMLEQGIGADLPLLKAPWLKTISEVLEEATLTLPAEDAWMQSGGKTGLHSEHLGYILAEMQYMQRTYPGMEW